MIESQFNASPYAFNFDFNKILILIKFHENQPVPFTTFSNPTEWAIALIIRKVQDIGTGPVIITRARKTWNWSLATVMNEAVGALTSCFQIPFTITLQIVTSRWHKRFRGQCSAKIQPVTKLVISTRVFFSVIPGISSVRFSLGST